MNACRRWIVVLVLAIGSAPTTAGAALFHVDPTLSNVTLSGFASFTGVSGTWQASTPLGSVNGGFTASGSGTLVEQGAGSLTTSLSGTIDASEAGGTLSITSGAITPDLNGSWRPDGSSDASNTAPAQLAGQVTPSVTLEFSGGLFAELLNLLMGFLDPLLEQTTYAAARLLGLDASGVAAVGGGGTFGMAAIDGEWTSGGIDVGGSVFGLWPLAGFSASLGSGTGTFVDGVVDQLILPFDVTFVEQFSLADVGGSFGTSPLSGSASVTGGTLDVSTRYVGRIVAATQPTNGALPEPATLVLVAIGLAGLAFARRGWRRPVRAQADLPIGDARPGQFATRRRSATGRGSSSTSGRMHE